MGNYYNGYAWKQREAILHERRRLEKMGALDSFETEGETLSFAEFCRSVQCKRAETPDRQLPAFIANGNETLLKLAGVRDRRT